MSGGTHPEVPDIFKVASRTLTARVYALSNAFSDYFYVLLQPHGALGHFLSKQPLSSLFE